MKYAIIIGSILVLSVGGLWFSTSQSESDGEQTVADTSTTTGATADTQRETETAVEPVATGGLVAVLSGVNELRYVEYTTESLASTADTNQIVFFHAPWCSTCRYFEDTALHETIPNNLTFLRVDYDSSFDLRQKHGVWAQSLLVYLGEDGETEDIWHTAETPSIADVLARIGA